MTHYIACTRKGCEGELAFTVGRENAAEFGDDHYDSDGYLKCSEGCILDEDETGAAERLADSRVLDCIVADAEAIVEASARAEAYRS